MSFEKFVVHIIKFNVQCSNLNVQRIKIRCPYSNFFYILVDERVGERLKNVLFQSLCKCFIINELRRIDFKGAY